jgi:hypothetical protein
MRGKRNVYRVMVGNPEGKGPSGRPRRGRDDIKMDLREVGNEDWIGLDWIGLN